MSFGRRLALFFLLIAIVPTAALIAILLFVSADSQRGKADARLSAGLETAVAIYRPHAAQGHAEAQRLARDPALATALGSRNPADLSAFARTAAKGPAVVRVEVYDSQDALAAAAGPGNAVAIARVSLTRNGLPVGSLHVSTTDAQAYVDEVHRLTSRQVVVRRGKSVLAATIPPPSEPNEPNETADVTVGGTDYRGHLFELNPDDSETLLLLGPPKEGGLLGIGGPAMSILIVFLLAAGVLAYALARALTRLHDRVAAQAVTDPMTGLWNRRHMAETLDREVSRALRFGHPISLIILDIDDFKKINDREGHLQGDIVLEAVADTVGRSIRTIDVAARYGGDEFALILVETGREGVTRLAERLREEVSEIDVARREGGTMRVTLSVGVATIPDSASDLESLVDAADRSLLRAKRAGKNQIRTAPVSR